MLSKTKLSSSSGKKKTVAVGFIRPKMSLRPPLLAFARKQWGVAISFLLFTFLIFSSPPAWAQFSSQVQVGNLEYNPDIARDSAGNIYVVGEGWRGDYNYPEIFVSKSTDNGINFGTPVPVTMQTAGLVKYPSIAIDSNNDIHIVYSAADGYISYTKFTNDGVSFSVPVKISGRTAERPKMAVYGNNVYVVWRDDVEYRIYLDKLISGGSFGTDVQVNDITSGTRDYPSITAGTDGTIYVTWIDGDKVYFTKSTNQGTSFGASASVRVDDSDSTTKYPSIVTFGSNTVYVAWEDYRNGYADVRLAKSINGGTSFETSVKVNDDTTSTDQIFPRIVVDSSGTIYAVWQDGRNDNSTPDIYYAHSTNGGASFSTNLKINSAPGKATSGHKYPALTVTDKVCVAWQGSTATLSGWQVYFSKGPLATVPPTPTTGTISGTITYGGGSVGNLIVRITTGPYFGIGSWTPTPIFTSSSIVTSGSSFSQGFTISGLPIPATYYVHAFRDVNSDGLPSAFEPAGSYDPPPVYSEIVVIIEHFGGTANAVFVSSSVSNVNFNLVDPGRVTGYITNNSTRTGTVGLNLKRLSPDYQYQTVSIGAGSYVADFIRPNSSYTFTAFVDENNNYNPDDFEDKISLSGIPVVALATTTVNLTIPSGAAPPPTTGSISGTVKRASDQQPIEGAKVEVFKTGEIASLSFAMTDTSGNYSITIATGTYDVRASATGYQTLTLTGKTVSSGLTTSVNFELNETGQGPGPTERTVKISGIVKKSDGTTVFPGITVNFTYWMMDQEISTQTVTDSNGHYEISGLRAGNFEIKYEPPVSEETGIKFYLTKRRTNIFVDFDQQLPDVVLNEGGIIQGTISNLPNFSNKFSLASIPSNFEWNIQKFLKEEGGYPTSGETEITGNGTYLLRTVPGTVDLYLISGMENSGVSVARLENIPVGVREEITGKNISVSYTPAATLTGKLSSSDGSPIPGGMVLLTATGKFLAFGNVQSDPYNWGASELSYTLPNLQTGDVTISAGAFSFVGITPETYTLVAGTNNKNFALTSVPAKIYGLVKDGLGNLVANATININGPVYMTATSAANGSYSFEGIPSGWYQLECQPPVDSNLTPAWENRYAGELKLDFTLRSAGSISGLVKDSADKPIKDVSVNAWGAGWANAYTNESGVYTLTGLNDGTYTVAINPPYGSGYQWTQKENIEVIAGSTTIVDFTFKTGSIVTGRITDEKGDPVANANINVSGAGWGWANTDTDGNYLITGLAEGSYTIEARPPYGKILTSSSTVFDLVAEETKVVNLVLGSLTATGKTITIRGKVEDYQAKLLGSVYVELWDTLGDWEPNNDLKLASTISSGTLSTRYYDDNKHGMDTQDITHTNQKDYNFELSTNVYLSDQFWYSYVLRVKSSNPSLMPQEQWINIQDWDLYDNKTVYYLYSPITLSEKIQVTLSNLQVDGASWTIISPPDQSAKISFDLSIPQGKVNESWKIPGGRVQVIVDTNRNEQFKPFEWAGIMWFEGKQYLKWDYENGQPLDPYYFIDPNNPDYKKLKEISWDELNRLQAQADWTNDLWFGGWDFWSGTTISKEIFWEGRDASWNIVPAGKYRVQVSMYSPAGNKDADLTDTSLTINIQTTGLEGSVRAFLDSDNDGKYTVGEYSEPLEGADVSAGSMMNWGRSFTDKDGYFAIGGLKDGDYWVNVNYSGYGSAGENVRIPGTDINSNGLTEAPTFYVTKGSQIVAKIVLRNLPKRFKDQWGGETPNLWGNINAFAPETGSSGWQGFDIPLTASTQTMKVIYSTVTVRPGTYEVRAEVQEYGGQTVKNVLVGTATANIEFNFSEMAATLSGDLEIANYAVKEITSTMSGNYLYLNISANSEEGYFGWSNVNIVNLSTANRSGSFVMRGLTPGTTYTLRYESWGSGLAMQTQKVFVGKGDNKAPKVTLGLGSKLAGTLIVKGNTAELAKYMGEWSFLPGGGIPKGYLLRIGVWSPDTGQGGDTQVVISTSQNSQTLPFEIKGLSEGKYWLDTHLEGFSFLHTDPDTGKAVGGGVEVSITGALTRATTIYLEQFSGEVVGQITSQVSGLVDLSSVAVFLMGEGAEDLATRASAGGFFVIDKVPTGEFLLVANEVKPHPLFGGNDLPTGRAGWIIKKISTRDRETVNAGTLELRPGASVEGTIRVNHSSYTVQYLKDLRTKLISFDPSAIHTSQEWRERDAARKVLNRLVNVLPLDMAETMKEEEGGAPFEFNLWESSITYRVPGLPAGLGIVKAGRDFNGDGIPDLASTAVGEPGKDKYVRALKEGETLTGIDFLLGEGTNISGTISRPRNQTGNSDEITVSLLNLKNENISSYEINYSTNSSESANKPFEFRGVNPGEYRILALAKGYKYKPAFSATTLTVSTASVSAGIIELRPGGKITGTLVDDKSGAGVTTEVKVACEAIPFVIGSFREVGPFGDSNYKLQLSTTSGSTGKFELPALPEGTYIVRIISLAKADDPKAKNYISEELANYEVAMGTTGTTEFVPITVTGEREVSIGVIKLKSGITVSGKVLLAGTIVPLANVRMGAEPADKKLLSSVEIFALTNADGIYALKGVDPSTGTLNWKIVAAARKGAKVHKYARKIKYVSIPKEIKDINFELVEAKSILKGIVSTSTPLGMPFPVDGRDDLPVAVLLLQSETDLASGDPMAGILELTNPEGKFEITGLAKGKYTLKILCKGVEPFIQSYDLPDGETDLETIILIAGATLSGTIRTPESNKVSTDEIDTVLAVSEDFKKRVFGTLVKDSIRKEVDRYEITGLAVGKWRVVLTAEEGKRILVAPGTVDIPTGTTTKTKNITYHIPPPGVEMRVKRADPVFADEGYEYHLRVIVTEALKESTVEDIIKAEYLPVGELVPFRISKDKKDIRAIYMLPLNTTFTDLTTFQIRITGTGQRGAKLNEVFTFFFGETQRKETKINPTQGGASTIGEGDLSGIAIPAGGIDIADDPSTPENENENELYKDVLVSSGVKASVKKAKGTGGGPEAPGVYGAPRVSFAPGAYSFPVLAMMKATTPGPLKSSYYDFELQLPLSGALASLVKLIQPSKITITYDVTTSTDKLDVNRLDEKTGVYRKVKTDREIDTTNKTLSINVSNLSRYAVFVDSTAPQMPQNLTAAIVGSAVNLTWQAVTDYDLAGYEIWRSTVSTDTGYVQLATTTATTYTDSTIQTNVNYWYKVLAYDDASSANKSNLSSAAPIVTGVGYTGAFITYAYPNPIKNPSANNKIYIRYKLPGSGTTKVRIVIYNLAGELVKEFTETTVNNGSEYREDWDGTNTDGDPVASGVYLYILYRDGKPEKDQIKKIAIIK